MRNAPCVLTSAKDLLCVEKKKKQPTANDGFPIATHYSPFSLRVIREHRANMLQLTRPGDILGVCWQKCVQRRMDELNKAATYNVHYWLIFTWKSFYILICREYIRRLGNICILYCDMVLLVLNAALLIVPWLFFTPAFIKSTLLTIIHQKSVNILW